MESRTVGSREDVHGSGSKGRALRPGDFVEVKSAAEILATLNERGDVDLLPFTEEMIPYCGRRFVVDRLANKICDTIRYSGSRNLPNTVLFLKDGRCDGSAHGGCQAECRFFWKEEWLRLVGVGDPASAAPRDDGGERSLRELLARNASITAEVDGKNVTTYRCQATELLTASEHHRGWDPRPYLEQYTCGNVTFEHFVRVTARAAVKEPLRKLGLLELVPLRGRRTKSAKEEPLNLQPGEWVQIKSAEEIRETLTTEGKNRGLWFDSEMLPFCGGIYRVRQRVTRFIDETNGRMIELKNDCVTLETVFCSGDLSLARWFCPRGIYSYWRESWLRRVPPPPGAEAVSG